MKSSVPLKKSGLVNFKLFKADTAIITSLFPCDVAIHRADIALP